MTIPDTAMTVTDEPEYFEAQVHTTTGRIEASAYTKSDTVLLSITGDAYRLTPAQARTLGRYLIKASKLAKKKP